jgi:hypothetical protein
VPTFKILKKLASLNQTEKDDENNQALPMDSDENDDLKKQLLLEKIKNVSFGIRG